MSFKEPLYNTVNTSLYKTRRRRKSLSGRNKFILFLNLVALFCLLLSWIAQYLSPAVNTVPAFLGLTYPLLLGINILFFLYWLVRRKRLMLLSLFAIGITINYWNRLYPIYPNKNNAGTGTFKIMSYNVRLFDLYNWSHNQKTKNKIFDFLKTADCDIYCFQEYFSGDNGYFTTTDTLVTFLDAGHTHIHETRIVNKIQHFGIATYTKYPIVNKGVIEFGYKNNNVCIYTDIMINKDTVRVYNMHLQSILFSKKDYDFIEKLEKEKEVNELEGTINIMKRMQSAFVRRAQQAEMVSAHIARSPYPVIVCGDFNDSPFSYTYNRIQYNLTDAFSESGSDLGRTYLGKFPSFRIDYILHSKNIRSYNYTTHDVSYSDHYPVSCYLKLNP